MIEYEDKFFRASDFLFFNPKRKLYFFQIYNTDESAYQYWCKSWENMPTLTCQRNSEDPFELSLTSAPNNFVHTPCFSNYENNITLTNGWVATLSWPNIVRNNHTLKNGSTQLSYNGYSSSTGKWQYKEDFLLEENNVYYLENESLSASSGYLYSSTSGVFANTTGLTGDTFEFEEPFGNISEYTGGELSLTPMLMSANGMKLIGK